MPQIVAIMLTKGEFNIMNYAILMGNGYFRVRSRE